VPHTRIVIGQCRGDQKNMHYDRLIIYIRSVAKHAHHALVRCTEWVTENAELIPTQARLAGEL
jgi:hypothetical protein